MKHKPLSVPMAPKIIGLTEPLDVQKLHEDYQQLMRTNTAARMPNLLDARPAPAALYTTRALSEFQPKFLLLHLAAWLGYRSYLLAENPVYGLDAPAAYDILGPSSKPSATQYATQAPVLQNDYLRRAA